MQKNKFLKLLRISREIQLFQSRMGNPFTTHRVDQRFNNKTSHLGNVLFTKISENIEDKRYMILQ